MWPDQIGFVSYGLDIHHFPIYFHLKRTNCQNMRHLIEFCKL
uniref:Uncharacterized protein n=1 Tax=Anguilla anguilla TaxID=7936 RepID=A0A0E9WEE7_ANGAN